MERLFERLQERLLERLLERLSEKNWTTMTRIKKKLQDLREKEAVMMTRRNMLKMRRKLK